MRDFEDVDGECNESQPCWDDDCETWDVDDLDAKKSAKWVLRILKIFLSEPAELARRGVAWRGFIGAVISRASSEKLHAGQFNPKERMPLRLLVGESRQAVPHCLRPGLNINGASIPAGLPASLIFMQSAR